MNMPFKTGFRVTSPYGERSNPFTEEREFHAGIDLVGSDTTVRAVIGGTVFQSRIVTDHSNRTWEWGNYVSILGDDGLMWYYCHLDDRFVEAGDRVESGQPIGIEGSTGYATGIHLHLEVRNRYAAIDPAPLLGIKNEAGYVWTAEPDYLQQASPWAKEAVAWAVERHIVNGRGDGNYAWQEPITREEAVVMLYRAREVL